MQLQLKDKEYFSRYIKYDPETGVFIRLVKSTRSNKGDIAGTIGNHGHCEISVAGAHYLASRLAWMMIYDRWPANEIDHINGNTTDNRLCNLREATRSQNEFNQKLRVVNTSGITGVDWYKPRSRWRARICLSYKTIHLGFFKVLDDAISARRAAEIKYFGEFALQGQAAERSI